MRRQSLVFIIILTFLLNFMSSNASEQPIRVSLDARTLSFDVEPTIVNSRTLVPLRVIFEALDIEVNWIADTKTVIGIKGDTAIELRIGNTTAIKNGQPIELDTPAMILNGRTMVPVRFVAESTGVDVGWDAHSKTVLLKQSPSYADDTTGKYIYFQSALDRFQTGYDVSEYIKLENELKSKHRVYVFDNGDRCYGTFKNGWLSGKAVYQWSDGDKYVGDFKGGNFSGKGIYYCSNGDRYIGDFVEGIATGYGTYQWPDGIQYLGAFKDSARIAENCVYIDETMAADAFQQKCIDILARTIDPSMTDVEKELAIRDYIIENTEYDKENYLSNTIPSKSHTAYGVIMEGIGVCQGYAEAANILLNLADIDSMMVFGSADGYSGRESHAWNLVRIDGIYYHLDVTLDDTDSNYIKSRKYINLSDAQIAKDHYWERLLYPESYGVR